VVSRIALLNFSNHFLALEEAMPACESPVTESNKIEHGMSSESCAKAQIQAEQNMYAAVWKWALEQGACDPDKCKYSNLIVLKQIDKCTEARDGFPYEVRIRWHATLTCTTEKVATPTKDPTQYGAAPKEKKLVDRTTLKTRGITPDGPFVLLDCDNYIESSRGPIKCFFEDLVADDKAAAEKAWVTEAFKYAYLDIRNFSRYFECTSADCPYLKIQSAVWIPDQPTCRKTVGKKTWQGNGTVSYTCTVDCGTTRPT
jgi:hypothetical protein